MNRHPTPPSPAELRRHAEQCLRARKAVATPVGVAATARLLHELQVHQVELEMQNQALLRARAEQEVSHARWAELYDHAPVGYLTLDAANVVREANLAATALLGLVRGRLAGRRFACFVAKADRPAWLSWFDQVLATDLHQSCEVTLAPATGAPVAVRVEARSTADRSSCRVALVDITERKRAEAALRASESEFAHILDATPFLLTRCSRDRRYRYASRAYAAMIGRTPDQITGRSIREIMGEQGWATIRPHVERVLAGQRVEYEATVHFSGIGPRLLHMTYVPDRNEAGQVVGWVASIVDVTEQRQSAARIAESEAALRALAARLQSVREEERTRLAREIHDVLAQDLTRLQLDLTAICRQLGEPVNQRLRQRLTGRLDAMKELTSGIVRTVQKIATELRPVVLDSLSLGHALAWLAEDFSARTAVSCTVAVPPDDLTHDPAVATALFRIAQESLTNVTRHARAGRVTITLAADGADLVLTVIDDGAGFAPDKLTDPHSLGLVGMRERAFALHGEAQIESAPGAGTTIRVRLPHSTPPVGGPR